MRKHLKTLKHILRRRFIDLALMAASDRKDMDYRSILVVAPHPDDEVIGLGGYLVQQCKRSERITIVYLTDGENSLEDLDPALVAGERFKLTGQVLSRLGLDESHAKWLHLPDGAIPGRGSEASGFERAAGALAAVCREVRPDAVFVTHPLESWPYDHVAAYELAVAALQKSATRCDLYGYWVWLRYSMPIRRIAGVKWSQVSRLDITESIGEKTALMKKYLETLSPDGRPWSGVLPAEMLKSFRRPFEVVEKLPVS